MFGWSWQESSVAEQDHKLWLERFGNSFVSTVQSQIISAKQQNSICTVKMGKVVAIMNVSEFWQHTPCEEEHMST